MPYFPPAAGGGGSVVFFEEGSAVGTATNLNFVGAGVTATYSGGTAIATIPGGTASGSIVFLDEGNVAGTATHLNVVGSGGTVAYSGGTATLTVSGGSGMTAVAPGLWKVYGKDAQNTASWSLSVTAVPTSRRLIVVVGSYARDVNTPTLTNVTFTEVMAVNSGAGGAYLSVFLGVPSSTSGTTLGITAGSSNWIIVDVYEVFDALTGSVVDTETLTGANTSTSAGTPIGPCTADPGTFFVAACAQDNATTGLANCFASVADMVVTKNTNIGGNAGMVSLIGRMGAAGNVVWYTGGHTSNFAAGYVAFT
jgi:hypothetical protein